jgi:sugar lactone lactonase YvrE
VACKGDLVAMIVDVGPGEPIGRRLHEVRMLRLDGSRVWTTEGKGILFGSNGIAFSEDGSTVYTNQHDTTDDVATVVRWEAATGRSRGIEKVPSGTGEILAVGANGMVVTMPFAGVVHVNRPSFHSSPQETPLLVAKRGTAGFELDAIKHVVVTDRDLFVLCRKGERSLLYRRPLDGSEGELVKCPLLPSRLAVARGLVAIVGFAQREHEVRLFSHS